MPSSQHGAWSKGKAQGKYAIILTDSQASGGNEDKSSPAARFLIHTMRHKAAVWNIFRGCMAAFLRG